MARAALPENIHPQLATYEKVVEYCRSLAAHRDVEVFHLLFLNTKNALICDEVHQTGTINHTPVYPRQVCVRALEVGAAALVVGAPAPLGGSLSVEGGRRDDRTACATPSRPSTSTSTTISS